jgi:RNA polymerase sigma-70 factor (ECF subfamily)
MATLTQDEETRLIAAAIAGDELAFETLYKAYNPLVRRAIMTIVSEAQIDDIVQETFMRVHQRLGAFNGDARLSTWVHRIAVNQALQYLRSKAGGKDRRTQSLDETFEDLDGTVLRVIEPGADDRAIEENEAREIVQKAIATLKPDARRLIRMILEGYGPNEIAAMLDEPITAIKSRIFRAKAALRAAIEGRRSGAARVHRVKPHPAKVVEIVVSQRQVDEYVQKTLEGKLAAFDAETAACA